MKSIIIGCLIAGICCTVVYWPEAAHFVDPGNIRIVDGHGEAVILNDEGGATELNVLDASDPVIRIGHLELSREEQIELMKECMEDALSCRPQERRGKLPTNTWCDMWVQITIAFFNYRTGDR